MMEKRNVATERRTHGVNDEEDLAKDVALFGPSEKKASAKDTKPVEEDEKADEETLK